MQLRQLGRTSLQVPAVGMGTWKSFDVAARDEPARAAVVDVAIQHGTMLFDTSPMYGRSNVVLANAVRGRRDSVLIADKIWTSDPTEGRSQIERALDLYGGRVDIYQIHNLVAWREHLPVIEELKARGKFTAIGATHYQHAAFSELASLMQSGRVDMIQIPYNVGNHVVQREILPLAAELGLGVLVMEPLGSGSLLKSPPGPTVLKPLEAYGVRTWAQALLKWILSDSRVSCVLPATSRPERAAENAAAGNPPWFDDDTRDYVSRLAR